MAARGLRTRLLGRSARVVVAASPPLPCDRQRVVDTSARTLLLDLDDIWARIESQWPGTGRTNANQDASYDSSCSHGALSLRALRQLSPAGSCRDAAPTRPGFQY